MRTLIATALFILAGTACAMAASDDLTIVSKITHNGKDAGTSTSYLSSDRVRMAQADGNAMMVDAQTGVMTMIDGKKKTYYTITKQDMQQMGAKVAAMMNDPKMQQGMQMMQNMSGAMAKSYEVKDTGVTRKIAGFSCEEWTITMAGMSTTRECRTTALQYPARAMDAFKEYSESMRSAMSAFGPMAKAGADLAEKRKAMKGFSIATSSTTEIMGMKVSEATEVVEVRRGSIPASAWEIPAGYTKVENPMLKMLDRQGRGRQTG